MSGTKHAHPISGPGVGPDLSAYPWRVMGFGHSGATGDGCADPTNNAAIYRLSKMLSCNDGRNYVNGTNGRLS